jgi:hypothetical protein
MASSGWRRALGRLIDVAVRQSTRDVQRSARRPRPALAPSAPANLPEPAPGAARRGAVTEYTGAVRLEYRPQDDGRPDPGEIVWAWVPFEENDGRGKDRPVLVIGRDGDRLLALIMSSQDHDRDAAEEARHGRYWVDVGTGSWDRQGRPSEVRVDRVLRIDPDDVRREGATLGRDRFDAVAAEVHRRRG